MRGIGKVKSKQLSHSELDALDVFRKILRYWDWRMTVVYFGLGFLFIYYSNPPVGSLDDPRVRVIEGVIVKVNGCIPGKRSGYVTLEDNNGVEHGTTIKDCSEKERNQFLGKSIRAYRYVKNGSLARNALEIHFEGKPRHTYEDNYGRHKLTAAFLYFGLALIPIALVAGHRWRKEKAKVLAREKCDQEASRSKRNAQ